MSRSTRKRSVRGAAITLWLAVALLSGASCTSDDIAAPTQRDSPEMGPALAATAAVALSFRQVSSGSDHSCGVTADDLAYCWGSNWPGKLGTGTYVYQYCMDIAACITQPVAVLGGLRFRNVSAGYSHTCGVTTDFRAYCWGGNGGGTLGIGSTTGPDACDGNESTGPCSIRPVAVLGGLRFRQVEAGVGHTCGLTTDDVAYCWGSNWAGQLGDGTTTTRTVPVRVLGGLLFRQISAGSSHTCAVTVDDHTYCWGRNNYGQVGDGTKVPRSRPALVAGGRSFHQVDAGSDRTCAVTTGSRALCWGLNDYGKLGDGTTTNRLKPRAVAGGIHFDRVTAGTRTTCGEATDDRAYCWGYGALTPVAVAGGLFFSQLSAGEYHICGRTPAAVAYCWGSNSYGQLGDGTLTSRLTPVPVSPPAP